MPQEFDFNQFSDHLFWDTNRGQLDISEHAAYIVTQVVEYGLLSDWKLLQALYSKEKLHQVSTELRSLDPVSLSFLAHYLGVDRTAFKCYTPKPSAHDFWNS